MAITNSLNFTRRQLKAFARTFKAARLYLGMTQLEVAQAAFNYKKSHCKVSRVERCAMPKVDAFAIERMAKVLGVPKVALTTIDPKFAARVTVAKAASNKGFWEHTAEPAFAQ